MIKLSTFIPSSYQGIQGTQGIQGIQGGSIQGMQGLSGQAGEPGLIIFDGIVFDGGDPVTDYVMSPIFDGGGV